MGIAQCVGQQSMAGLAYAAQIDVRFGDPPSVILDIGIGVRGNFARENLHLLGPGRVGMDG